jgi:hypothetical protein
MRLAALVATLFGLGASVLSCSSPTSNQAGPADSGSTSDTTFSCATRGQTYTAGLRQPGKAGSFTFVLISAIPEPPARGNNTWVLKVLDKNNSLVKDATFPPQAGWAAWPIGVRPYMPDHGHPSSAWPAVAPNSDGTYTIDTLYLYMAGLWEITINVQSGTTIDSATYSFCIEG